MTESSQSRCTAACTPVWMLRRLGRFATPIFLLLTIFAQNSYADAGTPLIWLTIGHLIFGNAIIGLVEGLIIAFVFRVRIIRCILIIILANYVSMVAGMLGVMSAQRLLADAVSIDNLQFTIIALGAVFFLLTIGVEWPFCYWALWGKDRRNYRALGASAAVNAASYAFLIPIYLSASTTSLVTRAEAHKVADIAKSNGAWVYFLAEGHDTLFRIRPDGTNREKIKTLERGMKHPELESCSSVGNPCLAVFWFQSDRGVSRKMWKPVIDSIPGATAPCESCDSLSRSYWHETTDLRSGKDHGWKVSTSDGLVAANKKTGQRLVLTLDTPVLQWNFTDATVLPGDQVICQLGNQIVLVDLNSHRIGLISHGISPVVILEK